MILLTYNHAAVWLLSAGMYYLRTRAAADAIKFTVDQQALSKNQKEQQQEQEQLILSPSRTVSQQQQFLSPTRKMQGLGIGDGGLSHDEQEAQLARMICSLENKDACLMCGS